MAVLDTSYKGPKLDKKELRDWKISNAMKQADKYNQESARYGGGSKMGALNYVAGKVVDNPLVSLRGATDTFSSSLARGMAKPEEKQYIEKPTASQMGGAIAQTALTLYPGATIAKGARFVAGSLIGKIAAKEAAVGTASTLAKEGLKRGISKLAGNVASLGGAGYGYETSQKLIEGKTGAEAYTPGAQTAVSAVLPFTPLALTGVKKTIGRAAQETFGATTGTGMGVVRAAYEAAKEGGEKAAQFTKAMRGNTSPDEIVSAAKESLGEIIQRRSTAYEAALTKIKGMTDQIDTTPIQNAIETGLKKFGVEVTEEGLDFSRSTLRFNKKAQEEINTIVNEMAGFGSKVGDNSPIGVDRLKRAFSDLYSDSSEARAFVANVTSETRKLLSKVPGYDEMSKSYGEATGLIKEIQKGLSLGNKASVDTAFRKLSTTLRTNNEFRQQLVDELDKISGGTLSAQVAGQQLSEKLPRGLAKIGLAGAGGIGLATGGLGVVALLKLAAVSSPRLIGEFANALGVSARYFGKFLEAIGVKAGKEILQKTRLPGDILLDSPMGKKLKEGVKNMKGKGGLNLNDVSGGKSGYADDLLQEARKYKSAEEFVKAQGEPLYHRTNATFDNFDLSKKGQISSGVHFDSSKVRSDAPAYIERFGKNQIEAYTSAKIADFKDFPEIAKMSGDSRVNKLKELGYGGYRSGTEVVVFDQSAIKTKSQLTDLYNKAQGGAESPLLQEAGKGLESFRKSVAPRIDASRVGDSNLIQWIKASEKGKGTGATQNAFLEYLQKQKADGAKGLTTTVQTKDGKRFFDGLVKEGYLNEVPANEAFKRGYQYEYTSKIDSYKSQLTDLYNKAQGGVKNSKFIKSIGDYAKENVGKVKVNGKIPQRILDEMADFTTYAAEHVKKGKELVLDEIRARKIAEKLRIKPDISNIELAKKFGKILEKNNWQPK